MPSKEPALRPGPRDYSDHIGAVREADRAAALAAGEQPASKPAPKLSREEQETHDYIKATGEGAVARSQCLTCFSVSTWAMQTFSRFQNYHVGMRVVRECRKCSEGYLKPVQSQHRMLELDGRHMNDPIVPDKPVESAAIKARVVCSNCNQERETLLPAEMANINVRSAILPCACVNAQETTLHRIVR